MPLILYFLSKEETRSEMEATLQSCGSDELLYLLLFDLLLLIVPLNSDIDHMLAEI